MLIENVISPRSIAYIATQDRANEIPFLGLQWFPTAKKAGIDLQWIKSHKGVSPSLAPSNYDALPVIRSRQGLQIEKTEMPFFRESIPVTERDLIEIQRAADSTDQYLASAIRNIYDDTTPLLESADVVAERMRMQLFAANGGHPSISIAANNQNYTYNYDPDNSYATNNYLALSGTSQWSDTTNSTPLSDLAEAKRKQAARGYNVRYALMTTTTFGYLRASAEVKAVLLSTNAAGTIFITDELVRRVVRDTTGLDIVIYDKTFTNVQGNTENYYPDKTVTLLPAEALGRTWYGQTPAERSIGVVTNAKTEIVNPGVAVTTEAKIESGVYSFLTTVSEIVLPSYERMDATYVIKVAS